VTEEHESVEYLHPDISGRMWLFTIFELTDGWSFEVSVSSPCFPDGEQAGPFLIAQHAMYAARTWIDEQGSR
jgi:hypothetical protein